jgi:hypothetical protein
MNSFAPRHRTTICALRRVLAIAALAASDVAIAGPPYSTDDPEPVEAGHWEIIPGVAGSHESGVTAGELAFDISYGLAEGVQLTLVAPVLYEHSQSLRSGLGRVETEVKWRFHEQRDDSFVPEMAFAPTVIWPTAAAGYDSDSASFLLPLWMHKDIGEWSVFGGGGYQINPDEHRRDSWEAGIAIARKLGERLEVGAELFHEKPDVPIERSFTILDVGVEWQLSQNWSLMGSAGPTDFGHSFEAWSFFVGAKAYY